MSFEIIRCYICNKKLKLSSIKCKCNNYYCKLHFNENNHNCSFDYKLHQKDKLEKILPIIESKKLNNL